MTTTFRLQGEREVSVMWKDHHTGSLCTALGLGQKASVYLSHARDELVKDTVAAMVAYAEEEMQAKKQLVVFWLDYTSIIHFEGGMSSIAFTEQVIKHIEEVALVMHPLHDPLSAKRLWCNFEVWTALKSLGKVATAITSSDHDSFAKTCIDIKICVQTASIAMDGKEEILKEFGEDFQHVNQQIRDALMKSLLDRTVRDTGTCDQGIARINSASSSGCDQGIARINSASSSGYDQGIARINSASSSGYDQGIARINSASSSGKPSDPSKSVDLNERLEAIKKKIGSAVEARALNGSPNLQGIAECFERSLATKEKMMGPNHKAVGQTCEKLAQIYMKLGEVEKANELHKRSLRIKEL